MGMMAPAAAGNGAERRDHTPASYLVSATNTTDIIGETVRVAPAVLGRRLASLDGDVTVDRTATSS